MVKMSTADFINLISNLKENVELSVSIDTKETSNFNNKDIFPPRLNRYVEDANERLRVGYEKRVTSSFSEAGYDIYSSTLDKETTLMYSCKYTCKSSKTILIVDVPSKYPPESFTIKGDEKYILDSNTSIIVSGSKYNSNRPIVVRVLLDGENEEDKVEDTNTTKAVNISLEEDLENKIQVSLNTQGYYSNTDLDYSYKAVYYSKATNNRLEFKVLGTTMPDKFTIDDRGITKTFEFYSKEKDEPIDKYIKIVEVGE